MSAPAGAGPAAARAGRRSFVDHVMGMPISIHLRAPHPGAHAAVAQVMAELRWVDATFSTYTPYSEISRLQRDELTLEQCSDEVREVERLCRAALVLSDGWFDAWNAVPDAPGRFDPTGLVKTWAVARAARRLDALGVAYAFGAGGDVLLRSHGETTPWQVGIEDPEDRTRVLATVPVHDGGVATSGIAARGAHILDRRTGLRVTEVLSATVIGPSLLWADVLATAAVARGVTAVPWAAGLHGTSGMLVLADGTVHRWSNAR